MLAEGIWDRRMTNSSSGSMRAARRLLAVVAALALLLSGFSGSIGTTPAAAQATQIPYGNVIVVLRDGLDPSAFASTSGVQPAFVYNTLLTGFCRELDTKRPRGAWRRCRKCWASIPTIR